MRARVSIREQGYSVDSVDEADDAATQLGLYDSTVATLPPEVIDAANAAAPSGSIIQQILTAIMTFLSSPQGQQLIAALIQMLLALIAGGG